MIDALASQGNKYRLALTGERFAMFSLIGTDDWEDYANLSFSAMQAESIADIDARLERLTAVMERMEAHVERMALIMEAQHIGPKSD